MSYLERLLNNVTSQKGSFTNSYPVIAEFQELNNSLIEKAIRESGDQDGKRTRAKCFRTRWDLHEVSDEVHKIGAAAIRLAQKNPLAGRSSPDGSPEEIEYGIRECWGLVYKQGEETKPHSHWPSSWAFVYNVNGCARCSPLVLPSNGIHPDTVVHPKENQLVIFPAWLNHEVPPLQCNHERIIVAGNLDIVWREKWNKEKVQNTK